MAEPQSEVAVPATGAWRDGDPPGSRRFADLGPVDLELGGRLPNVRVAYETHGILAADAGNAVLIHHALTGDSHVAGPASPGQAAGWWEGLIGPGRPLDTDRWFIVCPNVLGGCQGTTGPASTAPDGSAWGSRFPRITVGDQVVVERLLADRLGIERFALVIGGSMGGMRALEWLVATPHRVGGAVLLATCAAATADQIATQSAQILAITADPHWRGGDYYDAAPGEGPHRGLGLARRFAHLTYRSDEELEGRFGRQPQAGEDPLGDGRFAVQSYLDHQAVKLARRFDANAYIVLTDAMSTFDVGRHRGGVAAALSRVTTPVHVAGIDTDRLYPLRLQRALVELIPTAAPLRVISSAVGHDGFLVEVDEVGSIVRQALGQGGSAPIR
ncbi:MAG: homoserine O-acetyltransferase [Actinomycetales bacterium]|nr:homoserine O-acetyltransferase [Actinomycetales bacterium]